MTNYDTLVEKCMFECLQDAHSMIAQGASLEVAAEQAVNIVLDGPTYCGYEVSFGFKFAVKNAVLDTLEDFYL